MGLTRTRSSLLWNLCNSHEHQKNHEHKTELTHRVCLKLLEHCPNAGGGCKLRDGLKRGGGRAEGGIGVQQLLKPLFASLLQSDVGFTRRESHGNTALARSFGRDDRTPSSQHHIISLLVKRGNYPPTWP